MKFLVTGGSGFLGINLIRFLHSKGHQIKSLDLVEFDYPDMNDKIEAIIGDIRDKATVEKAEVKGNKVNVTVNVNGETKVISADKVLNAIGVVGNVEGIGLEDIGIQVEKNNIKVNKETYETNVKGIFAIGDVIKSVKFTHIAAYQAGIVLQNILFKRHKYVDMRTLPWVTYTAPQLAHVGLTESQAASLVCDKKRIITKAFIDNDRAQTEGETIGGIKLVATKGGKVLGVSILGENVDNLIGLWSLVITQRIPLNQIAELILPYPTRQEISKSVAIEFYRPLLSSKWIKKIIKVLRTRQI